MEEVILVDEQDVQVGVMEKMEAHEKGLLHRAFSVFIFNDNNELLLQKRASSKYHSGGLWTNTCCSHPRPGETLLAAAHRRMMEEMGFDCELQTAFSFRYRAELDNNLIECELDHVVFGKSSKQPKPNPDEVDEYKWMSLSKIEQDIKQNEANYTEWFKICFDEVQTQLKHESAH